MPADGEFKFSQILGAFITREYRRSKQSQCIRSAVANGVMLSGITYLAAYVGTYNSRKAFLWFGVPAFCLSTIGTTAICNYQNSQET